MTGTGVLENERPGQVARTVERWLVVRVAGERFGLPVSAVQEIVGVGGISKIKGAPFPVRGSVNLRGASIPVLDLGLRMGLEPAEVIDSRLVVVRSRGRRIGLLVDAVERLASVSAEAIQPLPDATRTPSSSCVGGVMEEESGLALLLDVERTLLLEEDPAEGNELRS